MEKRCRRAVNRSFNNGGIRLELMQPTVPKSATVINGKSDPVFTISDYMRDLDSKALVAIRRLAAKIPTPENYIRGIAPPVGELPGNILCFARQGVDELLKPSPRQRTQHHRCVLLVSLRGSGRLCIDSESFTLQPGQAQLIFPFQFHSYMEVVPVDICWVFITFESFSLGALAPLRSSPSRKLGPTEILLLRELVQCWIEPKRQKLVPLHLGLLLGRLAMVDSSRRQAPAHLPEGAAASLLLRVNSYIISHLDRPFGLKELAAAIGLSVSYLRGRFRVATGYSIGCHIRRLRLQQACNLLHSTALGIGEIAERCGFESVYSFSRTFKLEQGISPRDYRHSVSSSR